VFQGRRAFPLGAEGAQALNPDSARGILMRVNATMGRLNIVDQDRTAGCFA
jgi:hypothetical protein